MRLLPQMCLIRPIEYIPNETGAGNIKLVFLVGTRLVCYNDFINRHTHDLILGGCDQEGVTHTLSAAPVICSLENDQLRIYDEVLQRDTEVHLSINIDAAHDVERTIAKEIGTISAGLESHIGLQNIGAEMFLQKDDGLVFRIDVALKLGVCLDKFLYNVGHIDRHAAGMPIFVKNEGDAVFLGF